METRNPNDAARFEVEMLEGRLVFSVLTVAPTPVVNGDSYINFLPSALNVGLTHQSAAVQTNVDLGRTR